MAYSTDADLVELQPDILELGITQFTEEHNKAQADIRRELLGKWWVKKNLGKEIDYNLLTDSQFTLASAYLVLWKYALPQLTNWSADDRFIEMIAFYKARYQEEMADIMLAGVEYDANDDGELKGDEKVSVGAGRLTR